MPYLNFLRSSVLKAGRFTPPPIYYEGLIEKLHLPNSKILIRQYSRKLRNGTVAFGLGTSHSLRLAITKAYAEFLERKAYLEYGDECGFNSTNGFATHTTPSLAVATAIDELYERDSFLMHWYSETPMHSIDESATMLRHDILQTKKLGYITKFFRTFLGYKPTIACFLISETTGGFCVGLSSGKSLPEQIEKSFIEASINLFLCKDGETASTASSFNSMTLKNHRDFWLYHNCVPSWIFNRPTEFKEKLENLIISKSVFQTEYYHTIAAKSDSLIGITAGIISNKILEKIEKRINKINLGKNLIHPIP